MKVTVCQLDGICTMPVLPLAAGLVVSSAKADAALTGVANFEIVAGDQPPDQVVAELDAPDVLGLSLYIWNEQVSLEVARRVREAHPDCLVVVGGPSVPAREDAAQRFLQAHPSVDVLVAGEGEVTFPELLAAHHRGADLGGVAGLAYRDVGGEVRVTPPSPRLADFSATASPYLDGTFDQLQERYPGRFRDWQAVAVCETNRGCPFTCTFCSLGLDVHNRLHEVPLERVHAELEWIAEHRFTFVFMSDANFGIRPRDIEIARHMAGLRRRRGFPGYLFFYTTKNARERHLETVEVLSRAGIACQLALPTQTFDDGVLAAVRRANIPSKRWLKLRELASRRGIATYNELILGLPQQTFESFTASVVQAISPHPRDNFYVYLCRLLPNSEMDTPGDRERYGLETRRCLSLPADPSRRSHVDEYEEIVVATASMPVSDWRRAYTLGYLVSACFNQRILDVVIHTLKYVVGVDLGRYYQYWCDQLEVAAQGSVLAAIRGLFDRYLASILEGGPLLLPVEGAGDANREVGDAVVVVVLQRRDAFFDEALALTLDFLEREGLPTESIADLFRFQRLKTPSFGGVRPVEERFEHDWLAFWRRDRGADQALCAEPTTLRFVPPSHVNGPTFQAFVDAHLGALRTKGAVGMLVPVAP